ncbi:MAG: 23S rRNA (uracil(1939)-C(5))-methyltransferase RlmD [Acutalibacteraceae bacterium]|nr:23S rRNA (uracil(1939)-C(5))-methyltransferase RlmD [Acutalibacteraceae bacterium]
MAKKQTTAQKKTEFCPVAKKCGGCQLQNMSYPEQLSYKQAKVIRLLGKFCRVNEIIGMENPYNYRNKVQAAFGITRGGKIISGVYQSKSHRIVCIDECRLEDKKADEIIVTIRNMMKHYRMIPYNEDTGFGFLRHVLVKRGFTSGEIMVVLVTGTPMFPGKNAFIKELLKKHPEITTIIQNINREHTSLVLGNTEKVLYGKGTIEDTLCGCVFRISAKSFYQINPVQTEKLYSTAIDYAELTGEETVIDAYCGIGTIGIIAAQKAKEVIAVEVNKDAVFDAKNNARRNDTQNIRFYCDDAGKFMTKMAADGKSADVVFMDPPRAGSDEAFLSSVITLNPKRIVYVSCNPETLERDLKYLIKNGYKVKKIQPVDMFPHTSHTETVVLLSQRKADTHIDIKLDLSELDITAAETKATYQEIKDYVFEKFALKVSSLYISQVKTKCGIIERENYNKGKEGHRVPQCPKEKEEAIMDALQHFKMI